MFAAPLTVLYFLCAQHGMKMCMCFVYNLQNYFLVNLVILTFISDSSYINRQTLRDAGHKFSEFAFSRLPDKSAFFSCISYLSTKTYFVGTLKNSLNETVLLNTQDICV